MWSQALLAALLVAGVALAAPSAKTYSVRATLVSSEKNNSNVFANVPVTLHHADPNPDNYVIGGLIASGVTDSQGKVVFAGLTSNADVWLVGDVEGHRNRRRYTPHSDEEWEERTQRGRRLWNSFAWDGTYLQVSMPTYIVYGWVTDFYYEAYAQTGGCNPEFQLIGRALNFSWGECLVGPTWFNEAMCCEGDGIDEYDCITAQMFSLDRWPCSPDWSWPTPEQQGHQRIYLDVAENTYTFRMAIWKSQSTGMSLNQMKQNGWFHVVLYKYCALPIGVNTTECPWGSGFNPAATITPSDTRPDVKTPASKNNWLHLWEVTLTGYDIMDPDTWTGVHGTFKGPDDGYSRYRCGSLFTMDNQELVPGEVCADRAMCDSNQCPTGCTCGQ